MWIGTTKILKNRVLQHIIRQLKLRNFLLDKVNSVVFLEPTIRWLAELPAADPLQVPISTNQPSQKKIRR
jgi:hypothetical protein